MVIRADFLEPLASGIVAVYASTGAAGIIVLITCFAAVGGLVARLRRPAYSQGVRPTHMAFMREPGGKEDDENDGVQQLSHELVADASSDALVLADQTGRILLCNRRFREIFLPGPIPGRILETSGPVLSSLKEGGQLVSRFVQFFAQSDAHDEGQATLTSGQIVSWRTFPAVDSSGKIIGRIVAIREQMVEGEVESLKTEFVSAVSHELRTPLTSVKGSLELVLSRDDFPASDRELLEISLKNTERLIRLINDILDMSKLELDQLEFELENTDLAPVLSEAAEGLRPLAERMGIRLDAQLPPSLPVAYVDRYRVQQVVANLLSNAIKFSHAGSAVALRARSAHGAVEVEVQDWGVGVPKEQQQHLFKRFRRIRNPAAPDVSGTGLGLCISKAIVERLGGSIMVSSVPGQGSTFTFRLPPSIYRTTEEPTFAVPDAHESEGATVLLVEDDADLRHVIGTALSAGGFHVEATAAALEGVKITRQKKPAAIVLDLLLPDLSGYDLLRILKNTPDTRDIPVVLISVQPERGLAMRLGAADVLAKPLDGAELLYAVRRVIARTGAESTRPRILVGSPASRDVSVAAAAVGKERYEVLRSRDDRELVTAAQEHYPDLIVLDEDFVGRLEEADSLLASLRARPISRRIPIILLASATPPGVRDELLTVVRKPVNPDEFVRQVDQILGKSSRPQLTLAPKLVSAGSAGNRQ